MNQVPVNQNQVQNQVLQVQNQVLGEYRGGVNMKTDEYLVNAAMRCMMAYATEKARGEGQA